MTGGGSTSVPDMSLTLAMLVATIDHSLRVKGQPVAWALVLEIDQAAHYVSNRNHADALAFLEAALARCRADEPGA